MRLPAKPSRTRDTDLSKRDPLGRVFSVRRETWRLRDDPQTTPPTVEVLATRRTAADAADLAREAAAAFARHGFHKPSASWWAADEGAFHRFRVQRSLPPPALTIAVLSAAAGLTVLSVIGARRARRPGSRRARKNRDA